MKLIKMQVETKDRKLIDVEWDGEKIWADGVLADLSKNENDLARLAFEQSRQILEKIRI